MEIEKIEKAPYQLSPINKLNRLSTKQPRQGCLLRVHFKGLSSPGHADLFPWPELGDENLNLQIEALKEGIPFSLGGAALSWAFYEAKARQQKINLLTKKIYPNHLTKTDLEAISATTTLVKLKIGHEEIKNWSTIEDYFSTYPETKWRLDFNGLFSEISQAQNFSKTVSDKIWEQIDFVEDPFIPSLMNQSKALAVFNKTKVAVDRAPQSDSLKLADVWVIKPVYFSPDHLFSVTQKYSKKIVITSNMDHSLGQLIALHFAQNCKNKNILAGGLLTHDLYEDYPGKQIIKQIDNYILPTDQGFGWGCQNFLDQQHWKNL